ncbi:MAG: ABC transporter ATP-binding protein [Oscillospiraceae bacterium]|nr:ABC transporter ATP-binding protein [Oscillospiraceae bacterium]
MSTSCSIYALQEKRGITSAISVQGVTKKFRGDTVLNDVSREFEQGKIHGIVGNNGSGKTVLMKCICGFYTPSKGKVYVNGKRVGKDTDFPDDLGIIIETPGFLPGLSGVKNLRILASLKCIATEYTIRESILRVGLNPDLKKPVSKYSLGMRQRLGIAQAIMENPSALILDEPFNGLDKHSVADMRRLIKELRQQGKTIVLASHNKADIDELCDTVCEMDAGVMSVIR